MSDADRRAKIREYKEAARPAGVFRVRNTETGRTLIGHSVDLPGMLNRQRFQLRSGAHPNGELQSDWRQWGADAFAFEVVDLLEPAEGSEQISTEDLKSLAAAWAEKLAEEGVPLYRSSGRHS